MLKIIFFHNLAFKGMQNPCPEVISTSWRNISVPFHILPCIWRWSTHLTLSVSKRARSTKSSNVDKVFNWNGWCVFEMPLLEFIVDQLCFAETKFLLPWNAIFLFSNETKSFWKCTWQLKLCCQKGCKHRLQILFIFDVVSVNNLGQKLT